MSESSDLSLFSRKYEINSFLVNSQKRLGLFSLLNLLQDSAWVHATALGFGYEDSLQKKVFWVLTRQKVVMTEWPEWSQTIEIRTWTRPVQKSVAFRDFEIFCGDRKIGESTTSWVLLNTDTRKLASLDLVDLEKFSRSTGHLNLETAKLELSSELQTWSEIQVRNSDLDLHNHVNNTKYAQWILDAIPLDLHEKYSLKEYEVNFLAETHQKDQVLIEGEPLPLQRTADVARSLPFQGRRLSDNKILFVARLVVS